MKELPGHKRPHKSITQSCPLTLSLSFSLTFPLFFAFSLIFLFLYPPPSHTHSPLLSHISVNHTVYIERVLLLRSILHVYVCILHVYVKEADTGTEKSKKKQRREVVRE